MSPRPKSLEETLGAVGSLLLGDVPPEFEGFAEGEDDSPSIAPPPSPFGRAVSAPPPARAAAVVAAECERCDGEREVLSKGVVIPCPKCQGGRTR